MIRSRVFAAKGAQARDGTMLKAKPVTAIIPVRGGSKRIPGKNKKRLGKYSLLERAIRLALSSSRVDRTIVSTDDPEMQACAESYGVAAPNLRPGHLAEDRSTSVAVVEHVIEESQIEAGYLLLLQASSPLRTRHDLEALFDAFEAASDADAIVSLCHHVEPHPEKLQKIVEGRVVSYLSTNSHRPSQSLPEVYALNGAFYLVDRDVFLARRTFMPERTMAYVMPPERSINLDSMTDWHILEAMIAQGHWRLDDFD